MDELERMSDALADRVAAAAPHVVAIGGGRRHASGMLWQSGVIVASEQMLPDQASHVVVLPGGAEVEARPAGRDPGTNVAVLRLEADPSSGVPDLPPLAPLPRPGALALVVGADGAGGATARLGLVHAVGGEWHSMAGGRIDALLRLDARLGSDEGGPVLDAAGRLLGMSTTGPRRRGLVIPAATIARVVEPLLREGRVARGWLGVSLQPVMVPEPLRAEAGCEAGMMVVGLSDSAPAASVGVLPGDILLDLDGHPAAQRRRLAAALGPERVGQTLALRLLRAGAVQTLQVTVAAHPGT